MTLSNRTYAALVVASIASATVQPAFAESGRPSEPMAQAVVTGSCTPTAQVEPQGSYYTYLRVVDGMTRDRAQGAARHIDHEAAERSRSTAGEITPTVVSARPGASAVLR